MDKSNLLVVAMAEECRQMMLQWEEEDTSLPESMRRPHLEQNVRANRKARR